MENVHEKNLTNRIVRCQEIPTPKAYHRISKPKNLYPTSLTHALHGAADLGGHPEELAEVPARDLHHAVVQTGLKVRRGGVGDRVPGVEQHGL